MEKDKKYNIVLGIMIFLFILVVGFAIAWGLGIIGLKDNEVKANNNDNVVEDNVDVNTNGEDKEEQLISSIEETVLKEYIEKIYKRHESYIPEFTDINKADENWLWGVIYDNCKHISIDMGSHVNNSVVYREDMIGKGKELFGESLTVEPPKKEDINWIEYNSKYDCYINIGRGGSFGTYEYIISEMSREDGVFNVIIVEYLYDASDIPLGEEPRPYKINLKVGEKTIVTFDSIGEYSVDNYVAEENIARKYVTENKDKFVQKKLTIMNNAGKYNLISSEIIK